MKKKHYIVLLMFFLFLLGLEFFVFKKFNALPETIIAVKNKAFNRVEDADNQTGKEPESSGSQETDLNQWEEEQEIILEVPVDHALDVPFTAQAPYADWSDTFKEACEEASIIMLHYFLQGKELDKDTATKEILDMVQWEKEKFGYFEDTSLEEVAQILKEYYGYKEVIIKYDQVTADNIKYYIYNNQPVIVPAAGRLLGNKYFRVPGPLYHMLVITGYNSKNFITNDPGTKNGGGYQYSHDTLLNAIHDLPAGGPEQILNGRKGFLVVKN